MCTLLLSDCLNLISDGCLHNAAIVQVLSWLMLSLRNSQRKKSEGLRSNEWRDHSTLALQLMRRFPNFSESRYGNISSIRRSIILLELLFLLIKDQGLPRTAQALECNTLLSLLLLNPNHLQRKWLNGDILWDDNPCVWQLWEGSLWPKTPSSWS